MGFSAMLPLIIEGVKAFISIAPGAKALFQRTIDGDDPTAEEIKTVQDSVRERSDRIQNA